MSVILLVLVAVAVACVVAAEWPRLQRRFGADARAAREREQRKKSWQVLESEPSERDEFAASVERDLSRLPTIDERDRR